MHNFRSAHPESAAYSLASSLPGLKCYQSVKGWTDYWLGDHLLYSHRKTRYTFSSFPEKLVSQSHYELLILRKGDVSYILDNQHVFPQPGSFLLIHPGCVHTAKLLAESDYERYVIRFDEEAFNLFGSDSSPLEFIHQGAACIELPPELKDTLYSSLHKIEKVLTCDQPDSPLLAYSLISQLVCLINHHATVSPQTVQTIPQNILKIKQYVDDNYLTITTTSEVSEHFSYSREYVSRLFKEHFNTNLSSYLTSLKIGHSQKMLKEGASVTDACFQSGFRNMSTFTSAFRKQTQMNPSAYRKKIKKNDVGDYQRFARHALFP